MKFGSVQHKILIEMWWFLGTKWGNWHFSTYITGFNSHNRPLDLSHGHALKNQPTLRSIRARNRGYKTYLSQRVTSNRRKMGAESYFMKISSSILRVWSVGEPVLPVFSNTCHWDMIWYQRFTGLMMGRTLKVVIYADLWVRSHILWKFRVRSWEFEASESRYCQCFPTHVLGTWSGCIIITGWALVRSLFEVYWGGKSLFAVIFRFASIVVKVKVCEHCRKTWF